MLYVLFEAVDVLFFTANVLLWAVVSGISFVCSAIFHLLDLLVAVTVVLIPALGRVLEVVFHGGLQVLELLLNVVIIGCTSALNIIQSAMLYLAMLLTALMQLCVQLFQAVVSLDWPLLLERIRRAHMLVAHTILDVFSVTFNATVYIIGGLLAILFQMIVLISSAVAYTLNGIVSLARSAFFSIQLHKPVLSKDTRRILVLGGLIIFSVYVVYNLATACLRRYLRWQARKRRRQLLQDEGSARRRRPIVEQAPVRLPPEPRENSAVIQRRNHGGTVEQRTPRVRRRRRNPDAENHFGTDRVWDPNEQQYLEFLNSLLQDDYFSVKDKKSRTNDAVSQVSPQVEDKNRASESKDEGIGDTVMHYRMQELEQELMREKESKVCVVCLDRSREMMIRPCNHYCICEECSKHLNRCPICTKHFSRMEKVFNV